MMCVVWISLYLSETRSVGEGTAQRHHHHHHHKIDGRNMTNILFDVLGVSFCLWAVIFRCLFRSFSLVDCSISSFVRWMVDCYILFLFLLPSHDKRCKHAAALLTRHSKSKTNAKASFRNSQYHHVSNPYLPEIINDEPIRTCIQYVVDKIFKHSTNPSRLYAGSFLGS